MTLPKRTILIGCALWLGLGALSWAKRRDAFERAWFTVKPPGVVGAECVALLPKTATRPYPTVIYLHGSGGRVLGDGADLRQMAELGLAVVAMDYCQTNDTCFDAQLAALLRHLAWQRWADTNAMAWVGFSLGAEKVTRFALDHPKARPQLLVRLAGGLMEELAGRRNAERGTRNEAHSATAAPGTLNPEPRMLDVEPVPGTHLPLPKTLLIHGTQDEVFAVKQAEQVAAVLRNADVPVELWSLAGVGHNFGVERGLVYRAVGEYCLAQLRGAKTWASYRSVAQWQAEATPLWVWCLPALLWAVGWAGWAGRARRRRAGAPRSEPLRWRERAFCGLAGALAATALLWMGVLWFAPHLPVTSGTLAWARRCLVPREARADFEWLAAQPLWRGQRVQTLLSHIELARYNRRLVNWPVDEANYREFVLSPQLEPGASQGLTEGLTWRRPLWESLYPRIRKESSPAAAAQAVVRHLRERVTILPPGETTAGIPRMWRLQRADRAGFARVCLAGLRSVGIPARLDRAGQAEFWNGTGWEPAPQPTLADGFSTEGANRRP